MKVFPQRISPSEAKRLQETLRSRIKICPVSRRIKHIAGVDVSYDRFSPDFYCAIVLLSYESLEVIEVATAHKKATFPYVPGLLSFREGPVVLEAWKKLKKKPEMVVFDGHGIAHPRRMGLASHLGLALNVPSIGCAKTLLVGDFKEPKKGRGSFTWLTDKVERVGAVVRTKTNVKPIFVSPGHLVDIESSVRIILDCDGGYRVPEPTRQAHLAVNRLRMKEKEIVVRREG